MSETPSNGEQTASNDPVVASNEAAPATVETNGFHNSNGAPATNDAAFDPNTGFEPSQTAMYAIDLNTMNQTESLSADDIALYDRQIRLWGLRAQEQLRAANILLIGMKALGNEIAKNLVLAGIGSLTILDHEMVTEDDFGAQFLISAVNIGQNRAEAALPQVQKLNPRVQIFTDSAPASSKLPEYFSSFDITIATGLTVELLSQINAECRIYNRKFYAADVHGMYGYVFADLVQHTFAIEKDKGNIKTKIGPETSTRSVLSITEKRENNKLIEVVMKSEVYSPFLLSNSSPLPASISKNRRARMAVTPLLSCLRALFDFQKLSGGRLPMHNQQDLAVFTRLAHEKHSELQLPLETLRAEFLRSFIQNLGSEISPVASFLGGNLAQDVINVLGQREHPLQNFLLFDGEEFKGPIYSMHPIFDDVMPSVAGAIGMTNGTQGLAMINGNGNGVQAEAV